MWKSKYSNIWLSVKAGMGSRGTEWGECRESGWEWWKCREEGRNAGNWERKWEDQGDNLSIRVEMMHKKCGGIKIKGNVRFYKNIVLTLWYEKQSNN